MKRVYFFFSKFVPQSILKSLDVQLSYAGFEETSKEWIGRLITLTILLFLIPLLTQLVLESYGLFFITRDYCLLCGLAAFFLVFIPLAFWLHLKFVISARVDRAEEVFSDFLYNIASNLKGGMVPVQAFLSAAKPEYGVLGREAVHAYEKGASTGFVTVIFKELSKRIDSIYIKNFSVFFERAVTVGGKMAELIEAYADHFRNLQLLKKDLADRTKNFTVFIILIGTFIMPFLMAVAYTYVIALTSFSEKVGELSLPGFSSSLAPKVAINPESFLYMILAYVFISTILTSILVGVVAKGRAIFGVRYIFPLLVVSLGVFFLSKEVLTTIVRVG